jgi:hypothetical protein
MEAQDKWLKFFGHSSLSVLNCCLNQKWSLSDKLKASIPIIYCITETLRYLIAYFVDGIREALAFGGIFDILGITGKVFNIMTAAVMFQAFVIQMVVWKLPLSHLQVVISPLQRQPKSTIRIPDTMNDNCPTKDEQDFDRLSKLIYAYGSHILTIIFIFFHMMAVICALANIQKTNFEVSFIISTLIGTFIHTIDLEFFVRDAYMLHFLWLVGVYKIVKKIDCLFQDHLKKRSTVQTRKFARQQLSNFLRVKHDLDIFNVFSSRIATIWSFISIIINGCAIFTSIEVPHDLEIIRPFFILTSFFIFSVFSAFYLTASLPLNKSREMTKRIRWILHHCHHNANYIEKRNLLNIIKSQESDRAATKMTLILANGRMMDISAFLKYVSQSIRIIILLTKFSSQLESHTRELQKIFWFT